MRLLPILLLVSGCAFSAARPGEPSTCVVDPSDGVAKECEHLTAGGQCVHFGSACPLSAETCVVDPDDGVAKECFHVTADGLCAHFSGALCFR